MLSVNGKNSRLLVCQDRECGHRETISRTTNARCPKCHKRMELYVKGKEETFICPCGYKEKLSSFQSRREKEGAGVSKKDVQKYLTKQKRSLRTPKQRLRRCLRQTKTIIIQPAVSPACKQAAGIPPVSYSYSFIFPLFHSSRQQQPSPISALAVRYTPTPAHAPTPD